jgi:uncharacterized protein
VIANSGPRFTGTSEQFELASTSVGDTFLVTVWLPQGYAAVGEPLPTLFQLDGATQGELVATYAEELNLNIIVVAIASGGATKRFRDYTQSEDARFGVGTGFGAAFSAFLTGELIPRIEADYRADPTSRTLMGHSLGGLAVISQLLDQRGSSSVFANFAAESPSLWWNSGAILQREEHGVGELNASLFISTGDVESSDIIIYANEIITRFKRPTYSSLRLKNEVYANTAHSWSYEKAYPDALEFFYVR